MRARGLRRRGRWVAGVIGLVIAGGAAFVVTAARSEPHRVFCAGVGLMGPVSDSPEGALHGWLAGTRGLPATGWERERASDASVSFVPPPDQNVGYSRVMATSSAGGWKIDGACVVLQGR